MSDYFLPVGVLQDGLEFPCRQILGANHRLGACVVSCPWSIFMFKPRAVKRRAMFAAGAVWGGFLFFVLPIPVRGQSDLVGRLIEKVSCEQNEAQSYVLYLPSDYVKEKAWPVIFCFDASARGRIPVERLQAAAEKYGYIVAGSLTSRNGPFAANVAASQAMIRDVSAHFSIDSRRVYTAGVSGGARVATSLALAGVAQGVIACAAGFPALPAGIPQRVPFVLFGTTGTEDFNWGELVRLDGELEERKAPHRIVVFNGGHEWASAALMTEAVEWLELQAMRTGTRPIDPEFVRMSYGARMKGVPLKPALERWRGLQSVAADFAGLGDVDPQMSTIKELGESQAVRDEFRAERALMGREQDLMDELAETAETSAGRKQRLVAELKKKRDRFEDSAERRMVRRAIAGFRMMARATASSSFDDHNYRKAIALLELANEFQPTQKSTWLDLARAYALLGESEHALDALARLVELGFDDYSRLDTDPALAQLRGDRRFPVAFPRKSSGAREAVLELPVLRVSASLASVQVRLFYLPSVESEIDRLSYVGVEDVIPGSAPAQAGLARGMEIMAIQRTRIRSLTISDLDRILAMPVKNEIILTVRNSRDEPERDLSVLIRQRSSSFGPERAGHELAE